MRAKVPNILTTVRLALLPGTLFLLQLNNWWSNVSACCLFVIASVTDYWDGYLARKWGVVTTFGKFFDPLADKLLVICSLIMLQAIDRVNPWIVIIVSSREIFVTGLRALAMAEGIFIASSNEGKWKTGFQMTAIGFLMISETLYEGVAHLVGRSFEVPWIFQMETMGSFLLLLSVGLSLWSATLYYLNYRQKDRENEIKRTKGARK